MISSSVFPNDLFNSILISIGSSLQNNETILLGLGTHLSHKFIGNCCHIVILLKMFHVWYSRIYIIAPSICKESAGLFIICSMSPLCGVPLCRTFEMASWIMFPSPDIGRSLFGDNQGSHLIVPPDKNF